MYDRDRHHRERKVGTPATIHCNICKKNFDISLTEAVKHQEKCKVNAAGNAQAGAAQRGHRLEN
ncbi:hypothetical protein CASFOL_010134 [Castilleja foliolosa]|uniref:Zinc finger protein n=1 Tax=Castilleja foliolosa TaxID=1961234 RepID=A0ABD3DSU0_9LAMI